MTRSKLCLGLPLLVVLTACGDDTADRPTTETTTITPAAEAPMTQPAAPAAPAPGSMVETATLQEIGGSGAGGEATIRDRGAQTEVMVRLTGTPGGTNHPGHIHSGTCDNIGGVVQALQPITTDNTGAGTMTATVDVPGATVMNGQHIVVYHAPGGAPMACAPIPAHAM